MRKDRKLRSADWRASGAGGEKRESWIVVQAGGEPSCARSHHRWLKFGGLGLQPAHDLCQADARRSFAASVAVSSYLIKIATKGGSKGTFDQKAAKINTGQFATLSSIAAASPSGNRMCAGSRALLGRMSQGGFTP